MGKVYLFTKEQKFIFDKIIRHTYFNSQFYFTGGTALSVFYLEHRYSEDLDFFSASPFTNSTIFEFIDSLAKQYKFTFTSLFREVVYIFNIQFKNGEQIKVDFGYYPHRRVESGILYQGFAIDSLLDIAINKLVSINQRVTIRDFVDLYYLLDRFSIWDLMEGVKVKFKMNPEPYIISMDFTEIDRFTELPRMIKPVTLAELKTFYRNLAKELAKRVIE